MNEPSPTGPEPPALAVGLPLFALLALAGNYAGSLLRYPEIGAAILFPPYAFLTAALVVCRRRDWPSYLVVAAVAHFATHWPQWSASWVLGADVANIARALCAAALLRRLFPGSPRLDGIGILLMFVISAVIVAPALGATLGAANVMLHDAAPTYWRPWYAWFLSNALTGLSMLPACLVGFAALGRRHFLEAPPQRAAEASVLAISLAIACAIAFLAPGGGPWHWALRFYAPLPVLLWAALRFGAGGASIGLTIVAFAGILGADHARGPFVALSSDDSVLTLQAFILLTSLPVLCIAALDGARRGIVQLHQALVASLHDHVAILDAQGVVVEVNDSWRRFSSAATSQSMHRVSLGDSYPQACHAAASQGDADSARALAGATSVLSRERRRFEMEYEGDGREAYRLTVDALERADGGAVVTRADITASRRAQMDIEEQRRELSHLARVAVLGQLSGALAHELNQPLAAIRSNADAARRLLERNPPDLVELAEIVREIADDDRRAAEVIQRLRALLKRGETHLLAVDAGDLVREVLDLARSELIARRVTATSSVEANLCPVLVDRVQLQQVLLNLILNACEAMEDNSGDRSLQVSVCAAGAGARFSVRDRGSGIPAVLIDRLFDPFVTTKREGLGLGLSISRAIIVGHGGRLWAENNSDRGATVHCLLSFAKAPSGPSSRD